MGRLLLVVGLVMILGGCAGLMSGLVATPLQIGDTFSRPDEQAAKLCKSGEVLVTEEGPSEYRPGSGSSRSVQYFCVDDAGNRRDVTEEFAKDIVGQVTKVFTSLFSIRAEFIALSCGGVILMLVGAIMAGRGARRQVTVGEAFPSGTVVQVGGGKVPPELADIVRQAQAMKASSNPAGGKGDLTTKLHQLEEARKANLISQEEYDRLRQQILDSMS